MDNKKLIQNRFSRMLSSYDEHAKIQKRMAEKLIAKISGRTFDNILEIGCGTGYLTKLAADKFTYNTYTAVDIVEDCEKYIKEIRADIEFIHSDMESFISSEPGKYNLIISNAAFQWLTDFEGFVNTLIYSLTPGGILLFSTFGKENFREIYHISQNTLKYYSSAEIRALFQKYNPEVEEEIHIMAFQSPKDVLKHLHLTGVNALKSKHWTKSDMLKFENNYLNLCNQRPTLTYNPIYVKILNQDEKS